MLDHLPIIALMVEILLLVLISLVLYKNIFNPLATFACYNVGLFTIGSYLNTVLLQLDYIDFPISALNDAVWISVIWLASFSIAFLPIPKWIYHKYSFAINFSSYNKKKYIPYYILFALLGLISFILLCFLSDPTKWLNNPREAYLYNRVGVGQFYIGFVWSTLILFSAILFFQRPKIKGLIILLPIFIAVMYFSGKKSVIMALFVIVFFYYHFYIRNFNLFSSIIIAISTFIALLFLISFQGNQSFLSALSYFDYINTTSRFLHRYEEFDLNFGSVSYTHLTLPTTPYV